MGNLGGTLPNPDQYTVRRAAMQAIHFQAVNYMIDSASPSYTHNFRSSNLFIYYV